MKLPVLQGLIDRRILVNYRIDPSVLSGVLPAPFRPKIHKGYGIGGICLIRLKKERLSGTPSALGFSSENAAHRFAVEWDVAGETLEGVFVPRRDTSSCLSTALGGRLFPGDQNHAKFVVKESGDQLEVSMTSRDGEASLFVQCRVVEALPESSVFSSLEESSQFFERGSVGYSATSDPSKFDGIELHTPLWKVEALDVERVSSSLFDDALLFPSGTAEFDHALLMRDLEHEWHGLEQLCC